MDPVRFDVFSSQEIFIKSAVCMGLYSLLFSVFLFAFCLFFLDGSLVSCIAVFLVVV